MKSAKRNRAGTPGRVHPSNPLAPPPRRPWPLITLGVGCFAVVLIVGLQRTPWRATETKTEQKVYSAAADKFEPMAVTSHQTGKLDTPGVVSPLRLFAVTPGANSHEGLAVLGAAEESSRTYVAGAILQNGARLTELYADHVVLVRAAKSYTLYLPSKGRSDQLAKADTRGLTIGDLPAPQPPLSQQQVRASDAVRVAPVYDGTQISGFSVYPGSRAAQYERWGFKTGDVLVSLGGQPLSSSEQLESLLDQLAQGVTLAGEVRRGEQRIPVTLDGSALVAAAHPSVPPPSLQ